MFIDSNCKLNQLTSTPTRSVKSSPSFVTTTLLKALAVQWKEKKNKSLLRQFTDFRRKNTKRLSVSLWAESFLTIWTLSVAHKRQISRCHCKNYFPWWTAEPSSAMTQRHSHQQHRCTKNGMGWQENELLMTHLSIITENQWAYLV